MKALHPNLNPNPALNPPSIKSRINIKSRNSRGVALVLTLIMLSVITFLTVAFLTLSRREKGSTSTAMSQTDAKLMTDTALARAEADMISQIMAQNSLLAGDLLVSKTYQRPGGFNASLGSNLDNASYTYTNGTLVNGNDAIQNIANLFYDPRPPVFIETNGNPAAPLDFRFFVDFNRNRRFDTNGLVNEFDSQGMITTNKFMAIGDPEWVGVLEKPEYPHSGTNRFIGRYAFLSLPEGRDLDVNFIHNYAKANGGPMSGDRFVRNQGFGSWELNLAGLLFHVNTNYWGGSNSSTYSYSTNLATVNQGPAFSNACSILSYRYRTNVNNLLSLQQTLPYGAADFANDYIDGYSDGPFLSVSNFLTLDDDVVSKPWAGSVNTNHYFDIRELFDTNKTSPDFVWRLQSASTNRSSYDQYTFYRLLSQLGTHSVPEKGKIHLNYDNITTNVLGYASQTNFIPWTPLTFFSNAAQQLVERATVTLSDANGAVTNKFIGGMYVGTNFAFTNIQIYPTNQYTATLHRLLQMAANIYAATTNYVAPGSPPLTNAPFVFRPRFSLSGTNVYITQYDWVPKLTNGIGPFTNAEAVAEMSSIPVNQNIYGVPWIVSARKGFPNFNQCDLEIGVELTRKLQVTNTASRANPTFVTNQMLILGVTDYVGFETWNSYTNPFVRTPGNYTVCFTNIIHSELTNSSGVRLWPVSPTNVVLSTNFTAGRLNQLAFLVPMNTSTNFMTNSQYFTTAPRFRPVAGTNGVFEKNSGFPLPDWTLVTTNYFVYAMVDNASNIIDFVNVGPVVSIMNLTNEMLSHFRSDAPGNDAEAKARMWNPRRNGDDSVPPDGVREQMQVSLGRHYGVVDWKSALPGKNPIDEMAKFAAFLGMPALIDMNVRIPPPPPTNCMNAPYQLTSRRFRKMSFEVNDPLVHYMAQDMINADLFNRSFDARESTTLGQLNKSYKPWGGNRMPGQTVGGDTDENSFNYMVKDPLVRWSDDWDFPTNKFPSVGWLGRIHRGTPWQTIYLKAGVANSNDWNRVSANNPYTHPTNDWTLIDLFTTAPNDNASRGLLSVNQANVGGWSALLSGVIAVSNSVSSPLGPMSIPQFEPVTIEPFGTNISYIVAGINAYRATRPSGVFSSVGEILAVPQLTVASPYLNLKTGDQLNYGISDAAYERIPQQIMSLLKVGDARLVVYSFGQALKPAPDSVLVSPPAGHEEWQNLCTNYQIVSEMVTRTVLRVEGSPKTPKVVVESYNIVPED